MRTAELLNALAKADYGIECRVRADFATVTTLYKPELRGGAPTLFEAALLLAQRLHLHPHCPPEVRDALHEYDTHTANLSL